MLPVLFWLADPLRSVKFLSTFLDPILTTLTSRLVFRASCLVQDLFKRLNPVALLHYGPPMNQRLSRHMVHLRMPTLADVKLKRYVLHVWLLC